MNRLTHIYNIKFNTTLYKHNTFTSIIAKHYIFQLRA